MKAIIDGRRYNTEASMTVLVGEASNLGSGVSSTTDFGYWSAGLYRTGKGSFFLAGEGGPMSQFGKASGGNTFTFGEKIIPLSKEDALAWAEQWIAPEVIEVFFKDMLEEA